MFKPFALRASLQHVESMKAQRMGPRLKRRRQGRRVLWLEALEPRNLLAVSAALLKNINEMDFAPAYDHGSVTPRGFEMGYRFVEVGEFAYFAADDGIHGNELWRTNGSGEGTQMVADLNPNLSQETPTGSAPYELTNVGGKLYFTVFENGRANIFENAVLYVISQADAAPGRVGGNFHLMENASGGPSELTAVGNKLFFQAVQTDAPEDFPLLTLWVTQDGVARELDLKDDSSSEFEIVVPRDLAAVGDLLYFAANTIRKDDPDTSEDEREVLGSWLWRSDGTLAGTQPVKDFGLPPGTSAEHTERNRIREITPADHGKFYFVVRTRDGFWEVWHSDGTEAGTRLTTGGLRVGNFKPGDLTVIGDTLYFIHSDNVHGHELWRSVDGGPVQMVHDLIEGSGSAFRPPGDQNAAGVAERRPPERQLVAMDGKLFMTAKLDEQIGTELYEYDPSTDEFTLVKDINTAAGESSEPLWLTPVDGRLFFSADDGEHGTELWYTDGADGETGLVDIQFDPRPPDGFSAILTGSFPEGLSPFAGKLIFSAIDDNNFRGHGREPWIITELDFGDAPETYGTLLEDDGPRHKIVEGVFLGDGVDAEGDGQPSGGALGDDRNGADDESGIRFLTPLDPELDEATISITSHSTGSTGYLWGWVDFNGSLTFDPETETIFAGEPIIGGTRERTFPIPDGASFIQHARFRFTSDSDAQLGPTGINGDEVPDGEVEDYAFYDYGDLPNTYVTVRSDGGPRHLISGDYFLGAEVDADRDGAPDTEAMADDRLGDDEDGIQFLTPLEAGQEATIAVTVTADGEDGYFWGWFDFNGNGEFDEPDERVFAAERLSSGRHERTFMVPDEVTHFVAARFRFTGEARFLGASDDTAVL